MRYEQTTTVAGDADAVFAQITEQLRRRGLPAEVDRDSRTAVWASGPGGGCAGQLYVTDARLPGARVTVSVETEAADAVRILAGIDRALAALPGDA
ncbi:hypothetical protein [Streptomyces sp. B15]|uniref:hypothetical protein n=1 Tax=Streptomyces sp. B15 TaxID=1537797 RepID=UPI001B37B415|nr:hypothetical protein [Streptomyces sp. B15]MBQ1123322.1 hypothetical protein [Streptomyces sp. B15]